MTDGDCVAVLHAAAGGAAVDLRRISPGSLAWVIANGLGPLLLDLASEASVDALDRVTAERLEASRLEAVLRTQLQREVLAEVVADRPPSVRERTVLLKGAALASELYSRPCHRPMRDLDVLVAEEDLGHYERHLRALGFEQTSHNPAEYYDDHHHSMPFRDPVRDVWVELHTGLFPQRDPVSMSPVFTPATWLEQCRAGNELGGVAKFGPEYQMVYLACHWSSELRPLGSLVGLLDLALLGCRYRDELDWDRALDWGTEAIVAPRFVPVISLLHRLGLVDLPDVARRRLAKTARRLGSATVRGQEWLVRRYCLAGRSPRAPLSTDVLTLLWDGLCRGQGRFGRVFGTGWGLLFPPGHPERFSWGFQLRRIRSAVGSR